MKKKNNEENERKNKNKQEYSRPIIPIIIILSAPQKQIQP